MRRATAVALGVAALACGGATAADLAAGRLVFDTWCAPCHDPGIQHPGTNALKAKYPKKKSPVIAEWTDLPAVTVKYWVRHGISVMPQFRKTEVSDAELDALAAYLSRNTRGG